MPDQDMRARVARILRRDFSFDDITRLFLFFREPPMVKPSLKEIGDFIAHHGERTRGSLTEETRDWYAIANFHARAMFTGASVSLMSFPPEFHRILVATIKRTSINGMFSKHLALHAGVSKAEGDRLLKVIAGKYSKNNDGTLALNGLTQKEKRLVVTLGGWLITQPAFDHELLVKEFRLALEEQGLLERTEHRAFASISHAIVIFAISALHNQSVAMEDGKKSRLYAQGPQTPFINVMASVPVTNPFSGQPCLISHPIFTTRLSPKEHCDPHALTPSHIWNYGLELKHDGKLGRLG